MAVGNGGGVASGDSYVRHTLCVRQGVMMEVRSQERMGPKHDTFCSNSQSEQRIIQHLGTTNVKKKMMVLHDSSYDILFQSEKD